MIATEDFASELTDAIRVAKSEGAALEPTESKRGRKPGSVAAAVTPPEPQVTGDAFIPLVDLLLNFATTRTQTTPAKPHEVRAIADGLAAVSAKYDMSWASGPEAMLASAIVAFSYPRYMEVAARRKLENAVDAEQVE